MNYNRLDYWPEMEVDLAGHCAAHREREQVLLGAPTEPLFSLVSGASLSLVSGFGIE
jgi:hypothetical protein